MTLFLLGGTFVFAVLWLLESRSGIIAPLDRVAYPILLVFLTGNLIVMTASPRLQPAVEFVCYGGVALYFLVQITSVLLIGSGGSIYVIANTLQWMPVIYVAAFVFFSQRRAILAAGGTFLLSLAVPTGAFLIFGSKPVSVEVIALLANAAGAHLLVLLCLTLVLALRSEFESATRHARIMEDAAHTDPLTGVASRRGLERLLSSADTWPKAPLVLILFDIDHFKSINDRFGHLVGDEVLFSTAQLIKSQVRGVDAVGRWGGEEFLVIAADSSLEPATLLAERIRQIVSASSHPVAGSITLSAGLAEWAGDEPIAEAFRAADAGLYMAKARGRNRVVHVQRAPDPG